MYNQETEGFRTDARTCNLSYLQTDWYIDQMKRPAYDSPSLPITWDRMEYVEGTNEYVPVRPEYKKSIDALYAEAEKQALSGNTEALINVKKEFGDNPYELKNILKYWIRSKNEDLKVIPTDSIVMKVDKEAVRRSGMMIPGDSIPDYMHISLKGKRALYKSELMMLEMLAEAIGSVLSTSQSARAGEPVEYGQPLHSGRSYLPFHSVRYEQTGCED